ncbi:Immunoglobulin I-set domain [Popillia japonica]|uniref:Immunoglobulin I-set domain n=1 Tax=Popillia japonica TaxID=7064 RepID=A0AAW1N1D6_POPJA
MYVIETEHSIVGFALEVCCKYGCFHSEVAHLKKQFEKYPEDTRVQFGQHAELHCVPPAGVPPPVVYWMRGNQKVEQDTTVVISSEGDLVIGQARPQDSGNYTCVAENIAAKRMAPPVQITVVGKSTIIR